MADAGDTLTLTLVNHTSEIARALTAVEPFVQGRSLPAEVAYAVSLTIDEVVANVIRHGYDDAAEHLIRVRLQVDGDLLTILVEDDGKPFNPLLAPPPPLHLSIEERPVGGLGIHLIRTLMDEVEYRRVDGANVLTLRKRVGRPGPETMA
jgi:serine/threonine-protein kinase RsbW